MGTELTPLQNQIEAMRRRLEDSPDGEYYWPNYRFTDPAPEAQAILVMTSQLSRYFPQFSWSTTDTMDPSVPGLTVRWQRRIAAPMPKPVRLEIEETTDGDDPQA